jgi:uncharacterized DUF497 family protein
MRFEWNPQKNEELKRKRGISFEEIALLLGAGKLWAVTDHWNPEQHPGQRVFLIPAGDQIYAVPYVVSGDAIFLKTALPSRKLTRQYRQGEEIGDEQDRGEGTSESS